MADLYKQKPRKKKGYSFNDGKLTLGNEEQVYGPQNDPNATPVEKAGLINPKREQKAEKAWNEEQKAQQQQQGPQNKPTMDEETGEIKMNGANQGPQQEVNPLDYSSNPKDTQQMLKEAGYKISVDGKWGPNSMKALNQYYNDNPDVEPPFATELSGVFEELGIPEKSYVGKTNYTYKGKPIDYKRGEASSGGEVSPILVESVKEELPALKESIPGLRITGGNDAYHHSDEYYARRVKRHRSRKNDPKFKNMSTQQAAEWGRKNLKASGHTDGRSMDFATEDPEAARKAMLDNGFKFVKGHPPRYVKGNITILDEYAGKTSGGSGGHFHWGVGKHKGHKH